MAEPIHAAAGHHLPAFITSPGQTDGLFVAAAVFVIVAVVGIGVFYLKLHALPEQLAHRGQKVQFQIVAVLALLALFTHNHAFWVAGLLLALVPLPDFTSPLLSIATSLERIAAQAGSAPAPASTAAQTAPAASATTTAAPAHAPAHAPTVAASAQPSIATTGSDAVSEAGSDAGTEPKAEGNPHA